MKRPDVKAKRESWFNAQLDLDPGGLVFIDETGVSTKMTRLRGRSVRGERCHVADLMGIGKQQPLSERSGCRV